METYKPLIRKAVETLGSQEKLAKAIGISQPSVYHLLTNAKTPIRAELAVKIEEATNGEVTKEQLRPDIWPPAEQESAA